MSPAAIRKIIHVDMDAFYASVEQRDNPALRGQPVAVGHAAKRGVVAAASYEARKFGVRSAMPSTTALRQCPDLVFVPPRFEIYRAVSQQIRRIFADYTPLIEPLSLDEAYLDVTVNLRGIPTASATAEDIRARIFADTGLTASAGISYNKFLAKLASDLRKPNGQFVITPEMGPTLLRSYRSASSMGSVRLRQTKCRRLAFTPERTCAANPSPFCSSTSAKPARGISRSHGAKMIGPLPLIGRASHRGPRPRSRKTSRNQARSKTVSEPWRMMSGLGARSIRHSDRR